MGVKGYNRNCTSKIERYQRKDVERSKLYSVEILRRNNTKVRLYANNALESGKKYVY